MKRKTLLLSSIIVTFITVFSGCSKKTAKHKNFIGEKSKLELSFGNSLEFIDAQFIENCIGSINQDEETFGEQKSMLIFFMEDDCSTCKKILPVLENYIKNSRVKIYGYKENSRGNLNQNMMILKKLGSPDGINLTAGRLIAFTKGKRSGSISGTFDLETEEKINSFVENFFIIPPKDKIISRELKKLDGLKDLRNAVENREEFLLYFERYSCPDCRKLSSPDDQNIITVLAENFSGSIYKIVTEDSLSQLLKPVTIDKIQYESAFDYFIKNGTDSLLWSQNESLKQKTEHLEMLVALKQIPPCSNSDEDFLKTIHSFALNKMNKFISSDRNVPSFVAVSNKENYDYFSVQNILIKVYTQSQMLEEDQSLHRLNFDHYFSPDNTKISSQDYQTSLIDFSKIW